MNKSNIIEKEILLTRIEFKQYFEAFDKYINNENSNAELNYIALKTLNKFKPEYDKIISGIYNPDKDIKFQEYKRQVNQLAIKYADRDEQGEILLNDNKEPIITEQIIEFQNELKQLIDSNKELLEQVNSANENNFKFLNELIKFNIYAWKTIEMVPDKIPGIIMYFMFKEEF